MVYFKGLDFFLYFCNLFAIIYNVQCSLLQFSSIGSNLQLQCSLVSLSSSIISYKHWFLLLSHLFYTSMCLIVHSLYQHLSTFIIFHHHTMLYLFSTSINPMISLHRHFLQQYSVYGIISYSISYNSFHILFIFYLIVVSIISIYLFIMFYFLFSQCGSLFERGFETSTCYNTTIFNTFRLLSQLSHQFTILSVFGTFITCEIFSHFSYIHIRPLFNWFNLFWFLTHIDNSYFILWHHISSDNCLFIQLPLS